MLSIFLHFPYIFICGRDCDSTGFQGCHNIFLLADQTACDNASVRRIHQFGIRSGDREEFAWGSRHVDTHKFDFEGLEALLETLGDTPVYFTVDLDVMDPSVFPGTGTPEPGGVSFDALRKAVTLVCSKANVVGCDANELSPHYDQSGVSTAAACKVVREMLLALLGK